MCRIVAAFIAALVAALVAAPAVARADADARFRDWLDAAVWPEARAAGVARETFDAALAGVAPDRSLPGLGEGPPSVNWQAEFSSPARYFDEGNLAALARAGGDLMSRWSSTLDAVESRYGVPREIVVAIWGRESAFGRAALPKPAIPTLATLAFMGQRRDMYRRELVAALRIVEEGHIAAAQMRGSLAGALGQPQFLPSKYLSHAVDFDGDGRRDIWNSVPDTLASIARYLREHGWRPGEPWGVEARVPDALTCDLEGPDRGRPLDDWRNAGVTRPDGTAIGGDGGATRHLMMPAGRHGPAFLVSGNLYVLKSYNESDLYALFVGHLADRLRGGGRLAGAWNAPGGVSRGEVRAMQERLVAMGHDVGGADGLVGFRTRTAIGRWQAANGMTPTCFPDAALIARIREGS